MKAIRILAVVLCCALIFSFNVSADISIDFTGFDYIAKDSYGNIFISDSNIRIGVAQYSDDKVFILIGNQTTNAYSSLIFLSPYFYDSNGNIQYKLYQLPKNQSQTSLKIYEVNDKEISNTTITYANLKVYKSTAQVYPTIYNIALSNKYPTTNANIADTYSITSNHQLTTNYNGTNQSSLDSSSTIVDENFDLPTALGNQQITSNDIINAIDIALNNNDNIVNLTDNISILLNYGNNYNQIDQNIINGLGSAEDQLSNAEDAIQNKSQSLVNKVASQWTANKGVASSFLTTITPATSAIGTVTDNFFEAIPEEIKNAVITIMLIVFIGWLIGRVEG